MELRILTGKYFRSLNLLHPAISKELKTDDHQQESISKASNSFIEKYKKLMSKLRDARKKVKESSEIELLEILNERQKKKLKELFGTKFTVD